MITILVQTDPKKVVIRKKSKNLNQTEWKSLMKRSYLQSSCASRIRYCR
ncbi:hypothetical protein Golob_007528, partial [Gossypium lobatum]|nr:hypothetical protein [Gossypium lobatum]